VPWQSQLTNAKKNPRKFLPLQHISLPSSGDGRRSPPRRRHRRPAGPPRRVPPAPAPLQLGPQAAAPAPWLSSPRQARAGQVRRLRFGRRRRGV
jgi:hypothetical protein